MAPLSLLQSNQLLLSPISHSPSSHNTTTTFRLALSQRSQGNPISQCAALRPTTKHKYKKGIRLFRSTQITQAEEALIKRGRAHSGISSNMWWEDLKSAIGQRLNLEGIVSSVKVVAEQPRVALPHASVPDVRWIDWSELRRRGFRGVVFDKDNTITVPYVLAHWPPLSPSIQRCKAVFGEDNVAVFSNSAGLLEFDPDGSKARALEAQIGIKVIRHTMKKPAGNAAEIEKHFGCSSSSLVMVGDRYFTDIVYGNRNGFLTVLTKPLSVADEPFIVRQVRRIEECLVKRWHKKGLRPLDHASGLQEPQDAVCLRLPFTGPP